MLVIPWISIWLLLLVLLLSKSFYCVLGFQYSTHLVFKLAQQQLQQQHYRSKCSSFKLLQSQGPNSISSSVNGKVTNRDGRNNNNNRVREILELLKNRYGEQLVHSKSIINDTTTADIEIDWSKIVAFLYRATASPDRGLTIYKTRQVLDFMDECIPDRTIQRSIILHSPRILTKNVRTRLRPTVDFLQSLYDPQQLFITAISRNPDLLLTSGTGYEGDDLDLVETFLRNDLKVSPSNISKLKKSNPHFFQLSIVQLLLVVNFLRGILDKPYTSDDGSDDFVHQQKTTKIIAGLVVSHPIIFQLSVQDNLMPRIQFIQNRLSLHDSDVASLVKSNCGSILGLSVKDNLEPTINLLSDLLPLIDLRKAVLNHPQILGLSLENLNGKIAYFNAIDDMNRTKTNGKISLASRILMKAPAVYSLSLNGNIIPTINFLAKIWGQPCLASNAGEHTTPDQEGYQYDTTTNLSTLLSECPSILTLSLEGNIMPTVYFYVHTGYLSLDNEGRLEQSEDGKATIIRSRYIITSLYNRLLPRWYYYGKQRQQVADVEPFVAPPLYVLAGATDMEFCDKFGFDITDYNIYKEDSIPRLKFSSQFETWIHTGRPIDISS